MSNSEHQDFLLSIGAAIDAGLITKAFGKEQVRKYFKSITKGDNSVGFLTGGTGQQLGDGNGDY